MKECKFQYQILSVVLKQATLGDLNHIQVLREPYYPSKYLQPIILEN